MARMNSMAGTWIVRLRSSDGTSIEGRLDVSDHRIRFRPGTEGDSVPPLTIDRSEVVEVRRDDRELVNRVILTLVDGREFEIDNGLRSTRELAMMLQR